MKKATVANIDGHIFMLKGKPIKSIRDVFVSPKNRANLGPQYSPRSFRTGTISHWEALGVARAATLIVSGHKPSGVHEVSYVNLSDDQLVAAFARAGFMNPPPVLLPNLSKKDDSEELIAATA